MKSRAIATLALAAALALVAPVLAGGGVWVSDSGGHHDVGDNAMFLEEGATLFDLADLADGETRVFGVGAKQISVTREGDVVRLDRDPSDGERGLSVSCQIGQDSCRVVTFEDDQKVAIMIQQTRECVDGIGDCEGHFSPHGAGGAQIMIKKLVGCDGADEDCDFDMAELMAGEAHFGGHAVVELLADAHAGEVHDIRIMPMGTHGEANFFTHDDAESFDVGELLDGETRIFGFGDNRVTAVRDGDEARITREASGDEEAMTSTCRIGTDTCRILTFEDDPDRVMVLVTKRRNCVDGDCDVDVLHLGLGGAAGTSRTMQIHTDRDVTISEDD